MDTRGVNLNRRYRDPSPVSDPTIYAAKVGAVAGARDCSVACAWSCTPCSFPLTLQSVLAESAASPGGLRMYLDLHAHAGKQGCFLFGNSIADLERQVRRAEGGVGLRRSVFSQLTSC
jgi:hypothetical protein